MQFLFGSVMVILVRNYNIVPKTELPRPSSYPLLGPKYPLLGTIYPQLRVQGGSWYIGGSGCSDHRPP